MKVTVVELYVDISGKRRGRVCLRKDGLFQIGLEYETEESEDCLPYWRNDHPPFGLLGSRAEAIEAVQSILVNSIRIDNLESVEIDLRIGPWPEPKRAET